MVNWDPAAGTALSDEEVEMLETKGHLWHIRYPLLDAAGKPDSDQAIIVATTRPETMLGDEAVAVNPQDPRYSALVGRRCLLPLRNKSVPIIADRIVDPKFGTGCVKVTPAHDPNDYQMAARHNLPLTVVIAPNGTMTAEAGADFSGLDRFEARKVVVEQLTAQGLLLKVEDYLHNVGHSERTQVPIEPYLSEQWFLKYPSVAASTQAVESNQIAFHPERWSKTWLHWMKNIQDWCISRQLWWGHQIPIWRPGPHSSPQNVLQGQELLRTHMASSPELVMVKSSESGSEKAEPGCEACLSAGTDELAKSLENLGWVQDPDVLDTWFSSWLWPFATMGWPGKTETLKKFYPTSDLVTAPEILFFWVARMIMAGFEYMGELPFRNVYFTGIVRDKSRRKMSKSLGNSPDPLDLISQFGADALRFGTMRSAPLGQDVLFDEKDVELGRNFCNKLWNACRFRQMQGGVVQGEIDRMLLSTDDKWILLKLDIAIREINEAFAGYRFNEVTQTLYRFFWSEYCDWYVEASKVALAKPPDGEQASPEADIPSAPSSPSRRANTLAVHDFVLSHALRLFHPFLPFITEELWHGMGYSEDMPSQQGGATIMFAPWPKPLDDDFRGNYGLDDCYLEMVDAKYDLVSQGRNLRRQGNIPASKRVRYVFKSNNGLSAQDKEVIRLLLNAESLDLDPGFEPSRGTPAVHSEMGDLFLPLEGLVDATAERARLTRELEQTEADISKCQEKLNNPQFAQKAPAKVLMEHKARLEELLAKRNRILAALNDNPPS
jgi:valyl-tRNA synthetase